jgi:RNA polymerase sigma-70 factor (ECF subfamily)
LIRQIVNGETHLFEELFAPYEVPLSRMALNTLRCRADAEDALQEGRWKTLAGLHRFRGESSFRTWLTSIFLNEFRMILRKRRRNRYVSSTQDVACAPVLDRNIVYKMCQAETEREMRRLVAALPEFYRSVVEQRFYQEASLKETSAALSLTLAAVKSRQSRALGMLRRSASKRNLRKR